MLDMLSKKSQTLGLNYCPWPARDYSKRDAQPRRYTAFPICFLILVHLVVQKDAGKSSVDDELVPLPSHEKNSDLVVKKDAGKASVHDEQFVPLPSHEKNSDLVRYRAVRYEPGPEIWQKVACAWDQFQTRPNQFHQYESDSLFPAIPTATVR